ncbi:2Fe-2S iron-sulfur cluster-binding protein [Pelagibius sp.]|uniref:2Fe-2S iron-sulfur cluster-binding protein n=1 Tax=Pelagibius sp. TaxID=1931238 RepID=UPI003BAF20C9
MTSDPPTTARQQGTVTFAVDGRAAIAPAGLNLAAALLGMGVRTLRLSPVAKAPRGAFCFMGMCQECVVSVDDRRVRACLEPVRDGMKVELGIGDDC